jgi:archaellum component FlaC
VELQRTDQNSTQPGRRRRWIFAAALVGGLSLAACGSDDDQSAQEKYCEAGQSLESSAAALLDLDLITQGTSGLEDAVDEVEKDVDALRDSATEAAADEVDALEQSVKDLDSALSDVSGDISTDNVAALQTAVQSVATAFQGLNSTLTDCP